MASALRGRLRATVKTRWLWIPCMIVGASIVGFMRVLHLACRGCLREHSGWDWLPPSTSPRSLRIGIINYIYDFSRSLPKSFALWKRSLLPLQRRSVNYLSRYHTTGTHEVIRKRNIACFHLAVVEAWARHSPEPTFQIRSPTDHCRQTSALGACSFTAVNTNLSTRPYFPDLHHHHHPGQF